MHKAYECKAELVAYYHHLDNVVILRDNIITTRGEGKFEGFAEGRKEGEVKERLENAKVMEQEGIRLTR